MRNRMRRNKGKFEGIRYSGRKRLGQVFAKQRVLKKIVGYIPDNIGDLNIVEIGSADGRLTAEIINGPIGTKINKIYAIELDKCFCRILEKRFNGNPRIDIICGDVLKLDLLEQLPNCDYIIGNIPYYISSQMIKKLTRIRFKQAILMLQKEFVDKLLSNGRDMTGISVIARNYFMIEKLFMVDRNEFMPKPKVDSAVIRIIPIPENKRAFTERQMKVILSMFNGKKKSMSWHIAKIIESRGDCKNNDRVRIILEKLGVESTERIYNLEWNKLKMLMDEIRLD